MATINYVNYPNPIIWRSNVRPFTITHADMKIPVALRILKGTILSPLGNIMYKSGKAYAATTAATAQKLYKDHSFGVGDAFYDGATGRTISAIDTTTSTLYDTLTLDDVVTISLNEVVYSTASGAVATTGLAIVVEDVVYDAVGDTISLSIADKSVLDLSRMPNYWALALTGDLKTT